MIHKALRIVKYVVLAMIAAALIGIFCYFRMRLPGPEFQVDSYQELADALKKNPEIVLPAEEDLPGEPTMLFVRVPHRFRFSPRAGYDLFISVEENLELLVRCRTLESLISGGHEIDPPNVSRSSICFHTDTCEYRIYFNGTGDVTQEQQDLLLEFAQALAARCA